MTTKSRTNGKISDLIADRAGIMLDIGCGANVQPGFVGMDIRPLPGVEIVHDVNIHPWPIPDGSVVRALSSHLIEHIPPVAVGPDGTWFPFVAFLDEVWRICKPGAELILSLPYWQSPGFAQDPTHCNPCNEVTFAYFDPLHHTQLWQIYKPQPWYYQFVSFNPMGNMEIVLRRHSPEPDNWAEERDLWGPMKFGR